MQATGNGIAQGVFICSKLEQNHLEMEVWTFFRIQQVTWDQLLAFEAEFNQS